jgi:hypothetical protein
MSKASKKTRPLSLRDFPNDLYWRCKVRAAERQMSLKSFIVEVLEKATVRVSSEEEESE